MQSHVQRMYVKCTFFIHWNVYAMYIKCTYNVHLNVLRMKTKCTLRVQRHVYGKTLRRHFNVHLIYIECRRNALCYGCCLCCLMLCVIPWFAMNVVFIVYDSCMVHVNDDESHEHFNPRHDTWHKTQQKTRHNKRHDMLWVLYNNRIRQQDNKTTRQVMWI